MAPHNLLLKSPTGRLKLTAPSGTNDAEGARIRCHPTTRKYLPYLTEHCTPEKVRKIREDLVADESSLPFHIYKIENDGREHYIGAATIFRINTRHKSCEMGIIVSPEAHGGGIATDGQSFVQSRRVRSLLIQLGCSIL